MDLPQDLHYTQDHEWLSATTDKAKVGVTAYAVEQLGDVIHVDLPQPGDDFCAGDAFGTIESTKTVSDLYMPADGTVTAVNTQLEANPELVQDDPYKQGWLVEVELKGAAGEKLFTPQKYKSFVEESPA